MADQLTPQQIEALATPDDDSGSADTSAFYGNPKITAQANRPKATPAENAINAMMPVSMARGAVAGTLGIPGDLEAAFRFLVNHYHGDQGEAGPGISSDTIAPTTHELNESLPLKTAGGANDFATGVGNLLSPVVATKAAKAVPVVGKYLAPAAGDALQKYMGDTGMLLNAVKEPGGNWMGSSTGSGLNDAIGLLQQQVVDPNAKQWVGTKISKYIRNNLGTANDPLAAAPHIPAEQLNARAATYGDYAAQAGENVPATYTTGVYDDPNNLKHMALTGRESRTPWEQISDNQLLGHSPEQAASDYQKAGDPVPPWMTGPNAKPVYDFLDPQFGTSELGLDHMADYLNTATEAGAYHNLYGSAQGVRDAFGGAHPAADLIDRDLHIIPSDLSKMSVSDIANKTGAWNNYLAAKKANINTTLSSDAKVLKQYDDGHQWAELSSKDLGAEGDAMGHCVGGYCSSVEGGNTRILSLRDAQGKPHVTVELANPKQYADPVDAVRYSDYPKLFGPDRGDVLFQTAADAGSSDWRKALETVATPEELQKINDYGTHLMSVPEIRQIKGKGNAAPVDKYMPAVQDLVKNMGPWHDKIGDFNNTGLIRHTGEDLAGLDPAYVARQYGIKGIPAKGLYTEDEFRKALQDANPDTEVSPFLDDIQYFKKKRMGYAVGGSISAPATVGLATFAGQNGGPAGGTSSGSGGQKGDPTGYMSSAPTATNSVSATPTMPDMTGGIMPAAPGTGTYVSPWQFGDNGLVQQTDLKAPTYKSPFTSFLGQNYYNPDDPNMDPALAMTLHAGNAGSMSSGLSAFIHSNNNNDFQSASDAAQPGGSMYSESDMIGLAKQMGIDTTGHTGTAGDLQGYLNDQLKDYSSIGGMSAGWNPTGDARGSNTTLYKNVNGQLVPIQQSKNFSMPQMSQGFIGDHPGILAPFAVVGGGLLAAYAGAGAAASSGAAEGAGAGSAAGAGAGAETASGLSSFWGGLTPAEQAAITGAGKGAIMSGIQGQNPLTGAITGGVTGGLGAWAGPALGGLTGMPDYLSKALATAGIAGGASAVTGGQNPWLSALTAGGTSLGTSALGGAGVPSSLAGPAASNLIKYFATPQNTAAATLRPTQPAAAAPPTVDNSQPAYAGLGSYFTTPAKKPATV